MSKALNRPMFRRGGPVDSRGKGITSGLDTPKRAATGAQQFMKGANKSIREAREKLKVDDVVIFRIEQLYPFPIKPLVKEIKRYAKNAKFYWCQEEPKNMGAWFSVRDYIKWTLDYIGANNNEIKLLNFTR